MAEQIRILLWILLAALAVAVLAAYWVLNRRGRLDCGCVNDGGPVYGCMVCGFERCVEHRYEVHDCNARIAAGSENTDG